MVNGIETSHIYLLSSKLSLGRFVGVDEAGDIFVFHLRGNRFSLVGRSKLSVEYLLYSSSERNEVIFATKDHRSSWHHFVSFINCSQQHPLHRCHVEGENCKIEGEQRTIHVPS